MNKKFAAITAALTMVGAMVSGATPASAADPTPTLNFTQLQASSGYSTFDAFNKASDAVVNAAVGLHQVISMNMNLSVATVSNTFTLDTTHTNATAHSVITGTGAGLMSQDYTMYFADGKYIIDLSALDASSDPVRNVDEALAKLGKSNVTSVVTSTLPGGLADINPAKTFSSSGRDPMALLAENKLSMLFTEPVCAPITTPFTGNECTFNASVTSALLNTPVAMTMAFDFDQSGLLAITSIKEYLSTLKILDLTATQSTITDFTQVLPASANTVDKAVLVKASNQVAADTLAKGSAKLLVAKSKKFAGKKPVSLANLIAAAKNLKFKTGKIKNGLKINTTWYGEKSAYCVTTVKGNVAQKPC